MAWQRIKKRWLLLAATVIAVAVLFAVAHRELRKQVAAQLTDAFGGEVDIGSVSLGTRWHEARNVRLRSELSGQPWLTIDQVRIELPLSDAVTGSVTPRGIELIGLEAHLRLDENGRLVEPRIGSQPTMVGSLPYIKISGARVLVRQIARSPVVFGSIDAVVESIDDGLSLTGEVGESPLGALAGQATYDQKANTLKGSIRSTSFDFDTDALFDLPFDEPAIAAWRENEIGRARGTAIASVSFAIDERGKLTYRGELQLSAAELASAARGFAITQAGGRVVVEDGVAMLSECEGRFASGHVAVDGKLDFRSSGPVGELNVQLSGVALPLQRASTPLWPSLTGIAAGRLQLKLQHDDENWILRGTGDARLDDAVWDGLPLDTLTAELDLEHWQPGATNDPSRVKGKLQFSFALRDASLFQLATTFLPANDQLVESVAGAVSLEGRLAIPLQTAQDPASYWAVATVHSDAVTLARTRCGPLSARATLQQGRIQIEDGVLHFGPSGRAVVSGDVAMAAGDSQLGLVLERVPIRIAQPYLDPAARLAGDVHATLALTIPSSEWHAPASWQLTGTARSDALSLNDVALKELSADVSYEKNEFRLQEVRCQVADVALEGDATFGTDPPFTFDMRLHSPRIVLEHALEATGMAFPVPLAGIAGGQGHLSGSWKPLRWTGTGTAVVETAKLGEVPVSKVTLPWKIDTDGIEIADASALLLGGKVYASAMVPWRDRASSRVEGRFESWDVGQLSRQFPGQAVSLKGTGSGRFSAQHILSPEKRKAELSFAGVEAVIRGVEFRRLAGRVDVQKDVASVKCDGDVLDGTCSFQGQSKIDQADWRLHQIRGKATLKQIRLQRLWSAIGQQQRYGALHALGDAELDVQLGEPGSPAVAQGTLRLAQVRWGSVALARELSAKMSLSDEQLRIEDARLSIDQGVVVGAATVNPTNGRGEFQLRVEQVPLSGLLAFAPDVARGARGKVNGDFTGSLGDRWDATGVLRLDRGSVAGVPLTAVRLPLRMSRVPDSGRTRLDVELQSARIASGKAKGRFQLFWSGRFSIAGSAELVSADLRPIAKAVPGVSDLLRGQLSAKVDMKSGNLRSVEDLMGHFDVRLAQSQTLLLPGLGELTTAVGVPSPGAVTFSKTIIRGDIQRGVVKLDQMTMESPETRMWIDGQMDLQGTLDFDVAADTGSLSTINLVAAAVNPLQLLRRRLVFFNLAGSLRNPIVRPRTEEFLAQEVILFFLPVVSLR